MAAFVTCTFEPLLEQVVGIENVYLVLFFIYFVHSFNAALNDNVITAIIIAVFGIKLATGWIWVMKMHWRWLNDTTIKQSG